MKLYLYLNESVKDLRDALKYLDKESYKPIFDSGNFLHRGSNRDVYYFSIEKPRTDRKPKDTPIELHKFFDNAFQKKFGWKVRSEGVFVSPSESAADYYGVDYIFIPLGRFSYVWSPELMDLYGNLMQDILEGHYTSLDSYSNHYLSKTNLSSAKIKLYESVLEMVRDDKKLSADISKKFQRIVNELINYFYVDNNIGDAMKKIHEISIKCDRYLLVERTIEEYLENELNVLYKGK